MYLTFDLHRIRPLCCTPGARLLTRETFGEDRDIFMCLTFDLLVAPPSGTPGDRLHTHEKVGEARAIFTYLTVDLPALHRT